MSFPNLISVFKRFPKELFRVNNGRIVTVRSRRPGRQVYDIIVDNGLVKPKALSPSTYAAPNGASMRPNSPYQQSLVSWRFRGEDTIVYAVPKGTELPDGLLLVHERSDHYSLQPAMTMSIDDLSLRITQFLMRNGKLFTREQWLETYPDATESSNFSS